MSHNGSVACQMLDCGIIVIGSDGLPANWKN